MNLCQQLILPNFELQRDKNGSNLHFKMNRDYSIKTKEDFRTAYVFIGVFLAIGNEEFDISNEARTLAWVGYKEEISKSIQEKKNINDACAEQIKYFIDLNSEKIKHLNTLTNADTVDMMVHKIIDFIVDRLSEMKGQGI